MLNASKMFFKFIFYLFILKSVFGNGLRYPGTGDPWRQNDYEYNHLLSGWVKLHEEPTDWLTARVNCHMEGAFLTSPWSTEFNVAMRDLMKHNLLFTQRVNSDMMWSGVHSSFDEGALKSVDGKQVVSLQHEDLVPLERCGVFRSNFMVEARCNIALPYTCYRPGPPPPPSMLEIPFPPLKLSYDPLPEFLPKKQTIYPMDVIIKKLITSSTVTPLSEMAPSTEAVLLIDSSKCGNESLGYQFAELTGHCYKFHAHAVHTWDLAKSACEEEGAHLAIVNSDEEVKVLKKIYAKKIYGAPYPDTAAIGFYYDGMIWKTLEGESIDKAGYAKWRPEAPHFTARLGFIARDGLLYGYTNDVRDVPYICEKPALKQYIYQATETTETQTISTEQEEGFMPIWYPKSVDEDETIEPTSVSMLEDEAIESIWNTESVPASGELDKAIESIWNTESVPAAGELDKAIESIWNTESVPASGELDEAIESIWNTESVPASGELDKAIESIWNTESVPAAGELDKAIESIWNTESVPASGELDEAIESIWNTESVPASGELDKAIESIWNTESVPAAGELDKAIESIWNTESVPASGELDEAIDSIWNTESVPAAGELDKAIESIWNTESVPAAGELDEAIESIWNTESVPAAGELDKAIESIWNTESVPASGELDKAIESIWNTESVPAAGELDKTIESRDGRTD